MSWLLIVSEHASLVLPCSSLQLTTFNFSRHCLKTTRKLNDDVCRYRNIRPPLRLIAHAFAGAQNTNKIGASVG